MRISDWSSDVCSSDRQHLVADLGGRLVEADREAAGGRAVLLREVGGERVRVFVEQEVHPALAVDRDRPGLVAQHRAEAHSGEVVVHGLALPFGRGELDELEAVDAHRVLERGDGHAQVRALAGLRLRAHGGLLGDVATRRRCGGAACIGWCVVIVSDETICKAQRSMPDAPSIAGTAPPHAVLDLERFLPYRLNVLSNRVSQTLPAFYVEQTGRASCRERVCPYGDNK